MLSHTRQAGTSGSRRGHRRGVTASVGGTALTRRKCDWYTTGVLTPAMYTTAELAPGIIFTGVFRTQRRLKAAHAAYLRRFASVVHGRHDMATITTVPDRVRRVAGLPIGPEGAYFTGTPRAPTGRAPGQPSDYCPWIPTRGLTGICWPACNTFLTTNAVDAAAWLEYLCEHFLTPWGYQLSGAASWINAGGVCGALMVDGDRIVRTHRDLVEADLPMETDDC